MQQTWRWFGPDDPIPLGFIRQTGATGIVTALHHVPNGELWSFEEIEKRKAEVEAAGMVWSVVESVPISEDIKTRSGQWQRHIANYQQTVRNLAQCGIDIVCYNFMPVIDWTRTDLTYPLPEGMLALRFDATVFAAFDLFMLKRPGAENEWPPERIERAQAAYEEMDEEARERLTRNIIAGLPGAEESYTLDMFRKALARYDDIDADALRANLSTFIRAVAEAADEVGLLMCIHPDDPPRPLLGLPRVVSTAADIRWLMQQARTPSNGVTFCTGSFGVRPDNDLPAMVREFAPRIHFVHLRSTRREADPESFHEAPHLDGDFDMVEVIREVISEERQRAAQGRADAEIPMRPDHGHQIAYDIGRKSNPGYPLIGRLRGLAELRGVMRAVSALT
jgi:mannonate dehydratase